MISSVWRFAHLALALISCAFVFVAAITGVILAVDAVNEKTPPYKIESFNDVTLAQSLPSLQAKYTEILELQVDHNQFVTLEGFDDNGDDFKVIINPLTGEKLGKPVEKSAFIQWITSLHRSLFLHETGRFIVGVVSFLLMLITITGTILIIKRQQGIKHFFSKIHRDFFAQYFHVVAGRLLLIPILIIALTGTYLFMIRFEFVSKPEEVTKEMISAKDTSEKEWKDFSAFKEIKLADVEKIEFPFADDPEDFFKIKLHDKELQINQITGNVVSETQYSTEKKLEALSLNLHTGRTHIIWAIILGIASLNILFFIYSGFVITLKRKSVKIKNRFKLNNAEYVILVGSENGSTLTFANKIYEQLIASNQSVYLTTLNQYTTFEKAKHLIVCTSTYGLGNAPSNANQFKKLVKKYSQNANVSFSVIGFGSKAYKDYCAFAIEVDKLLQQQSWAKQLLPFFTVNDKSVTEFVEWAKAWKNSSSVEIGTTPALYQQKTPKLASFNVLEKTTVSTNDPIFSLIIKNQSKVSFQSGDLLAIYPGNDGRERLYSIAKRNNNIRLIVKLHENGLGSQFLYHLQENAPLQARIIQNKSFHFPKKAPSVIMIANGTGIAPFLGMIEENKSKTEIHLFAGFRYQNNTTQGYQDFAQQQKEEQRLTSFNFAYSREENACYVMHLIQNQAQLFAQVLENKGVIMICGALNMQKDVEAVLDTICKDVNGKPLDFYKKNKQILTDCY